MLVSDNYRGLMDAADRVRAGVDELAETVKSGAKLAASAVMAAEPSLLERLYGWFVTDLARHCTPNDAPHSDGYIELYRRQCQQRLRLATVAAQVYIAAMERESPPPAAGNAPPPPAGNAPPPAAPGWVPPH